MNLSILGPPGSGKGTQAERLKNEYNLYHIDIGQKLRYIAREDSDLGRRTASLINDKNILVSNEIIQRVLESELVKAGEQGVIIDGAPRRIDQVLPIEKSFENFGKQLDGVIFLRVREQIVVERISKRFMCPKCEKFFILESDVSANDFQCAICHEPLAQRVDDTPKGVRRRLKVFLEETLPVVEHYRKNGRLMEIDAEGSVEEVYTQLNKCVQSLQ